MKLLQLMIEYERQENLDMGACRAMWTAAPGGLVYLAKYMVQESKPGAMEDINDPQVY